MSKTQSSGLTGSAAKRPTTAILNCLDDVGTNWRALWTMAGLLELCQGREERPPLDREMVAEAAGMMTDELEKMRAALNRLEREIKR